MRVPHLALLTSDDLSALVGGRQTGHVRFGVRVRWEASGRQVSHAGIVDTVPVSGLPQELAGSQETRHQTTSPWGKSLNLNGEWTAMREEA